MKRIFEGLFAAVATCVVLTFLYGFIIIFC